MTLTTTLNRIRAHHPCAEGWKKLLAGLGKTVADDEPLPYTRIVEINGLEDALWACRAEPQYGREWRLFAVWCARQVQHLMKDSMSLAALDVAERYANGQASEAELTAARDAAWEAVGVAVSDAWDAARDAARNAASAAWSAVRDAAWGAAWGAAWDAASTTAWNAAWSAAWSAARVAAREAQTKEFLRIVGGDRHPSMRVSGENGTKNQIITAAEGGSVTVDIAGVSFTMTEAQASMVSAGIARVLMHRRAGDTGHIQDKQEAPDDYENRL